MIDDPTTTKVRSSRSGEVFVKMVMSLLISNGIRFQREVPLGVEIFDDQEIHGDFLLENLVCYPGGLRLECKWQDRAGSVDEKFLYLVESIRLAPFPAIVIADGGGASPGALAWLHRHVDREKFVAVYTLTEFMSWIQRAPRQ